MLTTVKQYAWLLKLKQIRYNYNNEVIQNSAVAQNSFTFLGGLKLLVDTVRIF